MSSVSQKVATLLLQTVISVDRKSQDYIKNFTIVKNVASNFVIVVHWSAVRLNSCLKNWYVIALRRNGFQKDIKLILKQTVGNAKAKTVHLLIHQTSLNKDTIAKETRVLIYASTAASNIKLTCIIEMKSMYKTQIIVVIQKEIIILRIHSKLNQQSFQNFKTLSLMTFRQKIKQKVYLKLLIQNKQVIQQKFLLKILQAFLNLPQSIFLLMKKVYKKNSNSK